MKYLYKLTLYLTGGAIFLALGALGLNYYRSSNKINAFAFGILQTASHPALDQARIGFIKTIEDKLGADNVSFTTYNAQGSMDNLISMAKRLSADKNINAIYAIATPAAQALAAIEKLRPILISAVTDAEQAGLLNHKNICGTTDMINIPQLIAMIRSLVPSLQTAALLYNPGETNSHVMVKLLQEELSRYHIHIKKIGVYNDTEITAGITMACRNVDIVITPADNLMVSAMPLIAKQALRHKKPLFPCDNPSVSRGAVACCGVNYYNCGELTGQMALDLVLRNIKPEIIGIQQPKSQEIIVNKATLNALEITIPDSLKNDVTYIEGT